MFVSTFAPCYPPSSSRYQFNVAGDWCFIMFQPDWMFDKIKASAGAKIQGVFQKHGRPYKVENNRARAEARTPMHKLNHLCDAN
jgi:FPC/CPF motif-containing protein YcgG